MARRPDDIESRRGDPVVQHDDTVRHEHSDGRTHDHPGGNLSHDHAHDDRAHDDTVRDDRAPAAQYETRREVIDDVKPKTSAAAAFGLIFGFSALIAAIVVIGAPLAVLFGLLALILGFVGMSKARNEWHVTGRGLAISGIILGALGLIIGGLIVFAGISILGDEGIMSELEAIQQDVEQGVEPDTDALEDELEDVDG